MTNRELGRQSSTLSTLYRSVGLLPWLSSFALLAAIVAHWLSRLPGPYTWLEPLRTFRAVLAEPRFPFALLASYWLGRWARTPRRAAQTRARRPDPSQRLRALRAALVPALLRALRAALVPALLRALLAIIADRVLLNSARDACDLIALASLGVSANGPRPSFKRVAGEAAYTAVCTVIVVIVCYAYTISKALVFFGGREFDGAIVAFEFSALGFVPHRVLAMWAALHPQAVAILDWIYFHCFEHMALTTVLLIALRRRQQRTEYLGAIALCYLIGGLLYHLLPARGPGYFEPRYFGYLDEKSLVTNHVRFWLQYNTERVFNGTVSELRTWMYIACAPSLHIAHEFIMLYYSRASRPAFVLSATFTLLTLPAVVILGWHYPTDLLAGGALAAAAIAIARWQSRALLPACLGVTAVADERD